MELIGKQIAIETILGQPPELHYPSWYAAQIEKLPPAPPEYLAEQAGILATDAVSRKAVAGIYTALWETIGTIMDRDEWDDVCKATANELPPARPPMPSNTSNALKALNSVNATRFDALDALADAYKGRSNALENQTKWNRMMLHLADLQLTYSPDWGANGQGDQKLYDFVTELIDEFSGWDVPDTNVGEMITKQQVIDVLERVKRTADDILYDGPVLMTYNDVLDSMINIVNLMPAVQQKIIHCKDCKHFKSVFAPNDNDGLCGHWHSKCDARTNRNGYCSHAERREVTT